jgi:hypothetical protein
MTEITWKIEPEDIEWRMEEWRQQDGTVHAAEDQFEEAAALAHLLINEVIFLNSHWWQFSNLGSYNQETRRIDMVPRQDARWTKAESELISIHVSCNDIFAWGCSDSEDIPYKGIEPLYRMWRADPAWGAAKWCCIQRNEQPQRPVAEAMKKAGAWDETMANLPPNGYDQRLAEMYREKAAKA